MLFYVNVFCSFCRNNAKGLVSMGAACGNLSLWTGCLGKAAAVLLLR